jgi:hypothetical protein
VRRPAAIRDVIPGDFEVRVHELDVAVHADCGENAPADRVEEGLGQLPIVTLRDEPRVDGLHASPDQSVGAAAAQGRPDSAFDVVDDGAVEVEALHGVAHLALPVPQFEPALCPPADLGE